MVAESRLFCCCFPGDQHGNLIVLLIQLVKSWRHLPDAKVTNNNAKLVCYYLLQTLGVANSYYMLGPLRRLHKCFSDLILTS